jgi:putative membrane protein insertion efficiency factor
VEAQLQTTRPKSCLDDTRRSQISVGVRVALFALRFYKAYLSLLFAGACRFEPTCSRYAYEAIERFGVARGSWLALKRLGRCQPLSGKFGFDPVPEQCRSQRSMAALRRSEAERPAVTHHEVLS